MIITNLKNLYTS